MLFHKNKSLCLHDITCLESIEVYAACAPGGIPLYEMPSGLEFFGDKSFYFPPEQVEYRDGNVPCLRNRDFNRRACVEWIWIILAEIEEPW